MWGVGRFADMGEFAETSRALGFCAVELNHQVTPAVLVQLKAAYATGSLRVSSAHDPCPNSSDRLELLPKVSDLDDDRRLAAVDQAKRTMELAASMGGLAVVLHVGDVWEMHGPALTLRHLHRQGLAESTEYAAALRLFKSRFAACQQPYLDAVARSLEPIVEHARLLGLQVGVENRYYVNEIPSLEQAVWLMDRLDPAVAGYWHDVGHAEVQARMGFASHNAWLRALSPRIKGVHLHDVLPSSITDHQAAGQGDLDLASVVPYIPDSALRVCEFDRKNTHDEVRAGLEHLAALGFFTASDLCTQERPAALTIAEPVQA